MNPLIPNRFLLDAELSFSYLPRAPELRGDLSAFTSDMLLPPLCELDGQTPFAKVYACWNEAGVYFGIRVDGKSRRPVCNPQTYRDGDVVRICTDTRNTRDQRRASRFCQAFYALPTGGGRKGDEPVAASHKLQRARQDAPLIPPGSIPVRSKITRTGFTLEVHLLKQHLHGFDPAEHPRLGFYYQIEDLELGQQALTVGDELLWYADPSTWGTAVLSRYLGSFASKSD